MLGDDDCVLCGDQVQPSLELKMIISGGVKWTGALACADASLHLPSHAARIIYYPPSTP